MSVILRNTLRFVGTAKYATNSTKYVRSISQKQLKSCDPDDYFIIKDNSKPTTFCQKLWSVFSEQVFVDENTAYVTKMEYFVASVDICKGRLITSIIDETFYLSPAFNVKVNEKSIEPVSTEMVEEEPFLLKNDELSVSRKDGKFTLQKLDSGETVTLNHTIYLEAHTKQRQVEKGGKNSIPSIIISDVDYHDTKITSKKEGKDEETQTYTPKITPVTCKKKLDDESILKNNKMKRVENIKKFDLQFPMTMSLEVAPRIIHIKELGDTFTVYHKVEIQTSIESTENLKNGIAAKKEGEKSKIGKIKILLNSGDLVLQTPGFFNDSLKTNYQIWITVDFDGPAPRIDFNPFSNTSIPANDDV